MKAAVFEVENTQSGIDGKLDLPVKTRPMQTGD